LKTNRDAISICTTTTAQCGREIKVVELLLVVTVMTAGKLEDGKVHWSVE
jgi:hypothetical protein